LIAVLGDKTLSAFSETRVDFPEKSKKHTLPTTAKKRTGKNLATPEKKKKS